MSASPSNALSAVLRRISSDSPAPSAAHPDPIEEVVEGDIEVHGFAEFAVEHERAAAPAAPPAPAVEPAPAEPAAASLPPNPAIARLAGRTAEAAPAAVPAEAAATGPAAHGAGREPLSRNRRLYRRVPLPAEFEIGGVKCRLIDLSIGGFAAAGLTGFAGGTVVPAVVRLTIDGIEVGTQLQARIVYVHQHRSSGRFVDLTPSQVAFLRYIVTWRGESIGAVGTTTLLDAITGGPDRAFPLDSLDRSQAAPRERWWAGLLGWKIKPPR